MDENDGLTEEITKSVPDEELLDFIEEYWDVTFDKSKIGHIFLIDDYGDKEDDYVLDSEEFKAALKAKKEAVKP